MVLPISDATYQLLSVYDNLICVIFLIDFFLNLRGAAKKSDYFIGQRGWLDLLGSIPSFGVLKLGGLLRLARLSRLARDCSAAARRSQKGAGQGYPGSPQPVRGVHYHLVDAPGPDRCRHARAASSRADRRMRISLRVGTRSGIRSSPSPPWGMATSTRSRPRDESPRSSSCSWGSASSARWPVFSPACWWGSSAEEEETPPDAAATAADAAAPALSVQEELKAVKEELAAVRQMLEKMGGGS